VLQRITDRRHDTTTNLLRELVRPPSPDASRETLHALAEQSDWIVFCWRVHRSGLAALCYERLRDYVLVTPRDVMEWLRAGYYQNVAKNLVLLKEFERIVGEFAQRQIDMLTFKGPIIAHLGLGLYARIFSDLDFLVRSEDMESVRGLLVSLGYEEMHMPLHPFHIRYVRMSPAFPVVVEVHFDVVRRGVSYAPDLAGIWERSQTLDVSGIRAQVPDIVDHLLLMILQLPHHHWQTRLMVDVAHLASKWKATIDWREFVARASMWRMRALVGSTVHSLGWMFGLILPDVVQRFAEPGSYVQRVQWRTVKAGVVEQLLGCAPNLSRLASYVATDDLGAFWQQMTKKQVVFDVDGLRPYRGLTRNIVLGLRSAPSLLEILLRSLVRTSTSS